VLALKPGTTAGSARQIAQLNREHRKSEPEKKHFATGSALCGTRQIKEYRFIDLGDNLKKPAHETWPQN
jgi:hypothetical protein